ncbi:MAG TPA: GH92 family glycosyl hydrolase [Kofleriaceae bacterium]
MRGLVGLGFVVGLVAACGDNDEPPLPEVTHAADWVDPRIGTGGLGFAHGSCFVGPAAPHGIAKPGPDTNGLFGTVSFQHYSGYFAEDDRIRGFSQVHLHGTGATDYGILSLMPTLAFDPAKTRVIDYEARFDKADEHVSAGYYGVTLATGIEVELTATPRVAVHRYTLPDAGAVVIDLGKVLDGGKVDSANLTVDASAHEVIGQLHHLGGMSDGFGGYTLYFVARVDKPFGDSWTWAMGTPASKATTASGTDVGAALSLPAGATTIAIGLSLVSLEGARKNLDTELPTLDFDTVHHQTYAKWDALLGGVLLTGGTEAQRRTFYTSFYHAFLMPSVIGDVDGAYQLAGHAPAMAMGWEQLSDLSLWDTYRTVSSLYAWLAPSSARNMSRSLVAFGENLGIYPKWPIAIGESGTMLGASAEIVLADAVMRGVQGTGAEIAWPLMRAAAMDPVPPPAGRAGRNDVDLYMQYGYVPTSRGRSVSMTAEYSHDDFALAQLAGALGHPDDHDTLMERRKGWRMLYDGSVGFLRGRNVDGSFATSAFDALSWLDEYAEANAWQSLFEPGIHDPDGIAEVFGGRDKAIAKLSEFFDKAEQEYANADESAGNFPRKYYWHGNEPDLNTPYLFLQLGRPDLTYKWARWVMTTMYSDQPNGVAGNDDGGTLGAWFVLSSLGLYPIAGSDRWLVTAPLFPRARVLVGGRELVIEAAGSGMYVRSVTVDGVPLSVLELTQTQLDAASVLHFEMTDKP